MCVRARVVVQSTIITDEVTMLVLCQQEISLPMGAI